MGILLATILIGGVKTAREPVAGNLVWAESAMVMKRPGYHPMLRFGCWDIIRFNRSSTYMFCTPDMIQQGQFTNDGGHFSFRAVMANELENSDIGKLEAEMSPEAARALGESYAKSMANFEADYEPSTRTLHLTYVVSGRRQTFELHAINDGDDQLPSSVDANEVGLPGLWHAPEPFPDKLDARTRDKIGGIEGLQSFAGEASKSNKAQFAILDLRVDKTFRFGGVEGRWSVKGSYLKLTAPGMDTTFTLSQDHNKLLASGKTAFQKD